MVQKRVYEEDWLREELKRLELEIEQRRKAYIHEMRKAKEYWNSLVRAEKEEKVKRKWLEECLSRKEVVRDKGKEEREVK